MRYALLALACACKTEVPAPWRLDQDRVLAARAEPPHLLPGQVAQLDALLAHADGATTVERPRGASAASAPGDLFTAVHYNIDHWEVQCPDEAALADARAALGLAADAAVPLSVDAEFSGLLAKKIVWLGDAGANPPPPLIDVPDPLPPALELPAIGSWFTSCGELRDGTLVVAEPCTGELAVVVRDEVGGVAWQVAGVHAN